MLEDFVSRAFLVAIRVGGLMTFAPFFSNAALPAPVKAGLTVMLTALLLPVYGGAHAVVPGGIGGWTGAALGEAAVGLVTGYATQFVFDGMLLAGEMIGFQFGFSLVNIIDPNSQVEVTVLSSLHELIALLIFIALGVERWMLRAMAASFRMIPAGSLGGGTIPAEQLLKMGGAMWLIGAEVAFPVLFATMLTDVAIGFLSKASPQFPALFFGISAKVLLGVATLYGVVAFWPNLLERYFLHGLGALENLLTVR